MYMRQRTLSRYGQSGPASQQAYSFPAPVGGVNAVSSLMQMSPEQCIYTHNLMPSEYGLRLRKGYREWAKNCISVEANASEVRTIVPFESNIVSAVNDRLFAVTAEGIWDVTSEGNQSPDLVATFDITDDRSGFGVWCEFTGDAAGDGARGHYLYYADAVNGIWVYEEATDLWSRPAAGTEDFEWHYLDVDGTTKIAFPVEDIAFVMVFKQRIWVILENEDDAWYLPIASITGELKKFTFGSKLPSGGNLVGLYNWSIDGGDGVDDLMVAIGRGGDVVIYQGEDPEITPDGTSQGPWSTRGTWFVGEIPNSRRVVAEYGPDLFILSTFGVSSLKDLLQGAPVDQMSASKMINRFLREDVKSGRDSPFWQLTLAPGDGFLQIITPPPSNTPYTQYNQNMTTQAWGFWEAVPIHCGATLNGEYFMGGKNGVVYINDGFLDDAQLPGPNQFQNVPVGTPGPEWSVVGANFICDGTQTTITKYETTTVEPLIVGTRYLVQYKIKDYEAGNHTIEIGGDYVAPTSVDAGVFTYFFTPTDPDDAISLVGNEDFEGTFYDIRVSVEVDRGEPIKYRTLTSFQAPQGHEKYVRVGVIRSVGVIKGEASFNNKAIYDYRVNDTIPFPAQRPIVDPSFWDSAIWDRNVWDFVLSGQSSMSGTLGVGRAFAIGLTGSSSVRFTLVGWDVSFTIGNFL